jgi:fructose-specific phosphotransferase system IIC component
MSNRNKTTQKIILKLIWITITLIIATLTNLNCRFLDEAEKKSPICLGICLGKTISSDNETSTTTTTTQAK